MRDAEAVTVRLADYTPPAYLIDEIAHCDLGMLRLGKPAFDYNVLRAHVGLV